MTLLFQRAAQRFCAAEEMQAALHLEQQPIRRNEAHARCEALRERSQPFE